MDSGAAPPARGDGARRRQAPGIPSRLGPVPLGARLLAGGIGAAWLTPVASSHAAGPRRSRRSSPERSSAPRARKRLPHSTGTPDLPWAVLEDVTAAALAVTAVRLASA